MPDAVIASEAKQSISFIMPQGGLLRSARNDVDRIVVGVLGAPRYPLASQAQARITHSLPPNS
jgi:hypothetical protein